jgi:hypothetical protein
MDSVEVDVEGQSQKMRDKEEKMVESAEVSVAPIELESRG